jgi:hypothetical protein
MKILERYIKSLLTEMSREDKINYRKNYGHIGAVKDALYIHWVGNYYKNMLLEDEVDCEEISFDYKKSIFLDDAMNKINSCLNSIKSVEVSCNLVNADRGYPIVCNESAFDEFWGDIGFLIKPKVITDGYGRNIGAPHYDVSQGNSVNNRFRKRVRPWRDDDYRKDHVTNAREEVVNSFPLDDKEAYRKNVDGFAYNKSEFFVVADDIVGIIYLDLGLDYFEEAFDSCFSDQYECEKLYKEKRKFEKEYLLSICNKLGIPLYESDSESIFDVPRLQSDL